MKVLYDKTVAFCIKAWLIEEVLLKFNYHVALHNACNSCLSQLLPQALLSTIMASRDYDALHTVGVFGDSGVGKTGLVLHYTTSEENDLSHYAPLPTVGVDFATQFLALPNGRIINLHICDCSGKEPFGFIAHAYLRNATGCIFVFDVTRRSTFDSVLNYWLDLLNNVKREGSDVIVCLAGTKSNLEEEREVSRERAQAVADSLGLRYFEPTSSSVNALFQCIVEEMDAKSIKEASLVNTLLVT